MVSRSRLAMTASPIRPPPSSVALTVSAQPAAPFLATQPPPSWRRRSGGCRHTELVAVLVAGIFLTATEGWWGLLCSEVAGICLLAATEGAGHPGDHLVGVVSH